MQLTIVDLEHPERKYEPIWVVNTLQGEKRGTLIMNVQDGMGNPLQITVPDTFLPINLTERAPREGILKSTDFRIALSNRYMRAIDDEEAKIILGQDGSQEEEERLFNRDSEINAQIAETFGTPPQGAVSDPRNIQQQPQMATELRVSPKIVYLVENMEENGEIHAINRLRSLLDSVTPEDWAHVKAEAKKLGYDKLVAFVDEHAKEES